jgi:hypothetical protein
MSVMDASNFRIAVVVPYYRSKENMLDVLGRMLGTPNVSDRQCSSRKSGSLYLVLVTLAPCMARASGWLALFAVASMLPRYCILLS